MKMAPNGSYNLHLTLEELSLAQKWLSRSIHLFQHGFNWALILSEMSPADFLLNLDEFLLALELLWSSPFGSEIAPDRLSLTSIGTLNGDLEKTRIADWY